MTTTFKIIMMLHSFHCGGCDFMTTSLRSVRLGYAYDSWHNYRPWLPKKTVSGQWVWFKKIYRRQYFFKPLFCSGYEYATAFELLLMS